VRFAWLQENSTNRELVKQSSVHPMALIRAAYNIVFWVFLIPFLFSAIDYGSGFIWFSTVIFIRLVLNLITNNFLKLTPQQFEQYPFRIP
jgi:hypothetical protein